MSHINQQISTHRISNLTELRPVHDAAISAETTDDQLGLVLQRDLHQLVVIDLTCRVVDAVLNRVVDLARRSSPRHRASGVHRLQGSFP